MRAAKTLFALGLLTALGLTGCISVQHDRDYPAYGGTYDDDYGRPPYAPAHGYRYYRNDVYHVYDAPTGVYVINGHPHHYYDGGWYYRYTRGYWERCPRLRGGHWTRTDNHYVPQRLYGRYHSDHPGKAHGKPRKNRDRDDDHGRGWQRGDHDRHDGRGRNDHDPRADHRREQRDDQRDQREVRDHGKRPERQDAREAQAWQGEQRDHRAKRERREQPQVRMQGQERERSLKHERREPRSESRQAQPREERSQRAERQARPQQKERREHEGGQRSERGGKQRRGERDQRAAELAGPTQ